jgi:hypothetical protein
MIVPGFQLLAALETPTKRTRGLGAEGQKEKDEEAENEESHPT